MQLSARVCFISIKMTLRAFLLAIIFKLVFLSPLCISTLFAFQDEVDFFQFPPKTYTIFKAPTSLSIDGMLNEPAWLQATWTDPFADIRGMQLPFPRFETRAKMLWDDNYLYIAAELEEPHLWATIKERDAVIFRENNFEIFIDPDGDTHHYYELEVNAMGTYWDLLLTKPYRNGGKPLNAWDIKGLEIGIDLNGSLNNPSDIDEGWTIEIAIPLSVLRETIGRNQPTDGSQWRLNFSRVEWQTENQNGHYVKKIDPESGKPFAEDNWVWSPQGVIDMHLPERWGVVRFSENHPGSEPQLVQSEHLKYEWILRELYYRQRSYRSVHGHYTNNLSQLGGSELFKENEIWPVVQIRVLDISYVMSVTSEDLDHVFYIREDSQAWKELKN